MKYPQPESVADFKARIALIMRERETGHKYSIIGAPRPDPCVVRQPGSAPTPSEVLGMEKENEKKTELVDDRRG